MRATDLFHMIHEYGALRVGQTTAFVVQTVLALDHVHAKGYVYRDLKPENLLVREDGYLRLTDFGFAKALRPGERAYTVCGTPDYLAPETLRHDATTTHVRARARAPGRVHDRITAVLKRTTTCP